MYAKKDSNQKMNRIKNIPIQMQCQTVNANFNKHLNYKRKRKITKAQLHDMFPHSLLVLFYVCQFVPKQVVGSSAPFPIVGNKFPHILHLALGTLTPPSTTIPSEK